ncbi:TonB-dependent receptor plug domain-containing protein [Mucilaginibacter rubeus]|uniref:TonB-dependent receptor n=1 Tax=Mucilaginibacter rubeus TaxID=2027860 RepID=A0AAE6JCH7_9SPHI|nr:MULTISPECIES: TonB-dependent receptor [Mucilaginibacter]QEM03194.1 TonB-dependent receptor plug domain-containing protein [Mucilaginibacter rubeus]QEM15813.1 TonB-dependent receptor plug domain-containing protein [Mucilaginibacter gossypii]QTE41448.1 TonB-dependent receptor [Mucilaginibacter rubeus]QTE48051.1 TonB-dependent receptor [Mucilaginibacter rubeus]QTE59445.1 TonB-dependent receptor [Mucilaginibacter rubeus]
MKYTYFLNRLLFLFSICLLFSVSANAQTIRGKVTDTKTGEPLTGATVHLTQDGVSKFVAVNLNGAYSFKNLKNGPYKIQVNYVGYGPSKVREGNITSANEVITVNVALQDADMQMTEIQVKAQTNKESDGAVRSIEKNAPMVINVLSANAIKLLPDVTVANALQRVSGVTIQRSASGEGRYAIIRGMDQRYNSTLVNGIKIPSPDAQYRFVPMDIFPSEMLERLEVIKALTPSMEGDAIGGVMNLVMKSAPSQFTFSANVSGGFSTLFSSSRPFVGFIASPNSKSPAAINGNSYAATYADFSNKALTSDKNISTPFSSTAGITIGDRFLNKKLGVIVSASYQNIYRGSNSKQLTPNAQPSAIPLPNSPQFSDAYDRTYSTQTERVGIHNKIDYAINDKNKISLYNLYIHQSEFESRFTSDTLGLGLNSTGLSKQITISNRSMLTKQNIYNSTLHGDHWLGNEWRLNWDGVYSEATRHQPDRTEFFYDANKTLNNSGAVTAEVDNNTQLDHHWENNRDKDISGYTNLIYTPKIAGKDVEFSAGGLYRHKVRDADYITYSLTGGKSTLFNNNFNAIPFAFKSAADGIGSNNPDLQNNYHVTENDNAEYLQVKFDLLPKLQVLGGVRIENTDLTYNTQSPETVTQRSGNIKYTDVLPSIHLRYQLTDNQNIRASYFAAISRPGFGEQVPYKVTGEYYDQVGNPYLKHITADNYDVRYEFFPGGADQLLLGSFYKKIYNPIEYFVVRNGGPSDQVIKPQNDEGNATNYGFEALATKFFGVIGFSINYTYTHSRITTNKLLYSNDPTLGLQQTNVNQTRPLQGQADHVGNASVLYKSAKLGLDMQLTFVYTGERLAQVSPYYNLDFYQHAYNQLDFSFEKIIAKRFSFYGKVNNITNAASKIYLKYPHGSLDAKQQEFLGKQDIAGQTLVQSDYYKTLFLGGFRYKL